MGVSEAELLLGIEVCCLMWPLPGKVHAPDQEGDCKAACIVTHCIPHVLECCCMVAPHTLSACALVLLHGAPRTHLHVLQCCYMAALRTCPACAPVLLHGAPCPPHAHVLQWCCVSHAAFPNIAFAPGQALAYIPKGRGDLKWWLARAGKDRGSR
jgi:hypothetical protein